MSGVASSASFLARRAAQKERVRLLYRRALRDTLNWAVHRHLFYEDASRLRERFDANKHVEDLVTIDRLIEDGEAAHNKWRHPDPYIVPWAPGGTKFTRNPPPPEGIEIVYDYGRELGTSLLACPTTIVTQLNYEIGAEGVISMECKEVVAEYGEMILELLIVETRPDKVCSQIGLCVFDGAQCVRSVIELFVK
ncbi:hypothetical protein H6P81_015408 [Aristolochia fimbriata]|uniref:NADH dehydrogenase [ubiquinone] 1 beta subcomplex subunit 9 n=1 Tax=Aristolochia fimbriata TaxID=158543 RepID=A0AAV7E5I2_ARIFI|nr:hypothetical protein H6P81_015408 [Aristolochia fimbriata]